MTLSRAWELIKMRTGNFWNSQNMNNQVAISRTIPKWWRGKWCVDLAPPWDLVDKWKKGLINERQYKEKYQPILDELDATESYKMLGENAILLCWCKPGEFCHRRLVADWLEIELGVIVEEV